MQPEDFYCFVTEPPPRKIYGRQKTVIGPGGVDLDMYLMKTIPMGERVATQLRWEVFNVANHPVLCCQTERSIAQPSEQSLR
jgi:hypothetical protein